MNKVEEKQGIWVFLSHSNEDYESVRIVRNYLEERHFRPIMFYLKCLNDEEEVDELIKREIDSRNRFILCDSQNAKKSKWVKTEVDYIKSKERVYQVIDLDKGIENIKRQIDTFIFRSSVFVSYSYKDEKLAKRVMKELKKFDYRIMDPMQTLFSSANLTYSLRQNIEEASNNGYVIILISKYSIKSKWVLRETQYALKYSMRRNNIIPVIIDHEVIREVEQILKFPEDSLGEEQLVFDLSNQRKKDIPSIIANKLLSIDYDYYKESPK